MVYVERTVDNDDVALAHALLAQHAGQHLDLIEKPRVGVGLFGPRYG